MRSGPGQFAFSSTNTVSCFAGRWLWKPCKFAGSALGVHCGLPQHSASYPYILEYFVHLQAIPDLFYVDIVEYESLHIDPKTEVIMAMTGLSARSAGIAVAFAALFALTGVDAGASEESVDRTTQAALQLDAHADRGAAQFRQFCSRC